MIFFLKNQIYKVAQSLPLSNFGIAKAFYYQFAVIPRSHPSWHVMTYDKNRLFISVDLTSLD